MALAIHPYISGQPHRIKYLEAIYEHVGRFRGRAALERRRDSRIGMPRREVVRMNQDLMVVIAREGGRSSNHAQGLLGAPRSRGMTPWNGMLPLEEQSSNDFGHQAFDAKK